MSLHAQIDRTEMSASTRGFMLSYLETLTLVERLHRLLLGRCAPRRPGQQRAVGQARHLPGHLRHRVDQHDGVVDALRVGREAAVQHEAELPHALLRRAVRVPLGAVEGQQAGHLGRGRAGRAGPR